MLFQNLKEAFKSIRENLLRAVLTILIIAFGLTSLIGVLTAIDGIGFWMQNGLFQLGANAIRIENFPSNLMLSGGPGRRKTFPSITYEKATEFKQTFENKAPVSITSFGSMATVAKFGKNETGKNLQVIGVDETYLQGANIKIDKGSGITSQDILLRRKVIVIRKEAEGILFKNSDPIGKSVQINGKYYFVIGTLASMGSAGAMGGDLLNLVPVSIVENEFPMANRSFSLSLFVNDPEIRDEIELEAGGLMRKIRGLRPRDEDNFGIIRMDGVFATMMESLSILWIAATGIAIITLFSASIGLMNIMLVSVTERTREIGIRKAIGATRSSITQQFLIESILICQFGGIIGIIMGILVGNLVGFFLGNSFFVPWTWVIIGVISCFVVGVAAGIFPAIKAAKVDPIDSLRYE